MLDHSPRPLVASFPQPSDYPEYDELRELMAEDRRRRALDAAGHVRTVQPKDLAQYGQRIALAFDGVSSAVQAFRVSMDGLVEMLGTYGEEPAPGLPVYRNQLLHNLVQPTTGSHKRRRALAKHHRLWCRRVARWAVQATPANNSKPVIKKGLTR